MDADAISARVRFCSRNDAGTVRLIMALSAGALLLAVLERHECRVRDYEPAHKRRWATRSTPRAGGAAVARPCAASRPMPRLRRAWRPRPRGGGAGRGAAWRVQSAPMFPPCPAGRASERRPLHRGAVPAVLAQVAGAHVCGGKVVEPLILGCASRVIGVEPRRLNGGEDAAKTTPHPFRHHNALTPVPAPAHIRR